MSAPIGDPTPEESAGMREDLMRFISRSSRRRTVRRRVIGASAVTLVVAAATAWIVVAPADVRERQVECFSAASLDAASAEAVLVDAEVPDPLGTALSNCSALWEAGLVDGAAREHPVDGSERYPVPELTACLRPDLTFVVFPSASAPPGDAAAAVEQPADAAEFCDALGLSAP